MGFLRVYHIIVGMSLLLGGSACSYLHVNAPFRASKQDWEQDGGAPDRPYRIAGETTMPVAQKWRVNIGAGVGAASPLVTYPYIWVGTRKGEVHVIHEPTGKVLGQKTMGEAIEGGLAIAGRIVYVPVAWGKYALVAYDVVDAWIVWRKRGAPVEASLLLLDDRLIVADIQGKVQALDLHTGAPLWTFEPDSVQAVRAAPVALPKHQVAIVYDTGEVVALAQETGAVQWRTSLNAPVWMTPVAGCQRLFVPTMRSTLVALDGTSGKIDWIYWIDTPSVKVATPAVDSLHLVFGATDGIIRALDPVSGTLRWQVKGSGAFVAAPLLTDDMVWIGGMDRFAYAIDKNSGEIRWRQRLKGRVKTAPVRAGSSYIFIAEPMHAYAFQENNHL